MRPWLLTVILLCASTLHAGPRLTQATLDAWANYIDLTEKRIDKELQNTPVVARSDFGNLKSGKIQIQRSTTKTLTGKDIEIPDGTIHHWTGAIFVPGVTLDKLIAWMQDYPQYQDYFTDVERSYLLRPPTDDTFDFFLHLTMSKFGVTAHFNSKHNVAYTRRSKTFVSSVSRSTEIRQLADAHTPAEKEIPEGEDSGYLWRLYSYWRFSERDGGVVVECEAIALSRSLGWGYDMVTIFTAGMLNPRKIAESIARDALVTTLTNLRDGARGGPKKPTRR